MSPEVPCRLVELPRRRRLDEPAGYLVFTCPWCARQHVHGAGPDLAHPLYGHRTSHCHAPDAPAAYVLVPLVAP